MGSDVAPSRGTRRGLAGLLTMQRTRIRPERGDEGGRTAHPRRAAAGAVRRMPGPGRASAGATGATRGRAAREQAPSERGTGGARPVPSTRPRDRRRVGPDSAAGRSHHPVERRWNQEPLAWSGSRAARTPRCVRKQRVGAGIALPVPTLMPAMTMTASVEEPPHRPGGTPRPPAVRPVPARAR